jgi:sugar lactone lactonase YvrE
MRRKLLLTAWITVAAFVLAAPLAAKSTFPERITLPDNFRPEGIAIGKQATFYVGSIPTGAIYRGSLKTGEGSVFIPGATGRAAIGVELDHGRLFVAGGPTGKGFVYNADTGALLVEAQLAANPTDPNNPTFVNDVVVARGGAYFTDSRRPVLYRLGRGGGVDVIPLSGAIVYGPGNNANGIDTTPNGKTLIIVQSNVGRLFTVNRNTGVTREITLNESVENGDGIHLDGRTLYVVQNRDNKVAVVRLSRGLGSGTVTMHITDPDFDVPTTIDEFGKRLYAVNARFRTPPAPPETEYWVAQFRKVNSDRDGDDDDGEEEDDD